MSAAPVQSATPMRQVVSYAQRGGRMTSGQRRAWEAHWARLGCHIADLPTGPLDVERWFGRRAPLVLEIGSGMGESTAAMAAAYPEFDHLVVEVYKPGLAQLLLRVESAGIENLRLLRGDALNLLDRHIAPGTLHGVRAFFLDPWPKRRHHKRRLVQPEFVALVESRLEPGATLHLATDWEDYAEQMLAVCEAEPALHNLSDQPSGWLPRPDWRPVSKFEQRARQEGRVVRDLLFARAGS